MKKNPDRLRKQFEAIAMTKDEKEYFVKVATDNGRTDHTVLARELLLKWARRNDTDRPRQATDGESPKVKKLKRLAEQRKKPTPTEERLTKEQWEQVADSLIAEVENDSETDNESEPEQLETASEPSRPLEIASELAHIEIPKGQPRNPTPTKDGEPEPIPLPSKIPADKRLGTIRVYYHALNSKNRRQRMIAPVDIIKMTPARYHEVESLIYLYSNPNGMDIEYIRSRLAYGDRQCSIEEIITVILTSAKFDYDSESSSFKKTDSAKVKKPTPMETERTRQAKAFILNVLNERDSKQIGIENLTYSHG